MLIVNLCAASLLQVHYQMQLATRCKPEAVHKEQGGRNGTGSHHLHDEVYSAECGRLTIWRAWLAPKAMRERERVGNVKLICMQQPSAEFRIPNAKSAFLIRLEKMH